MRKSGRDRWVGAPTQSTIYQVKNLLWGTVTESAQLHPAHSIPRVHYGKYQQSARISACTENAGAEGFSNGPKSGRPTRRRPATSPELVG